MGKHERAVAFVVARLSSRRLAAKHLRRIGDRTLLDWVFRRLAECAELDDVVLATVAEPANEPLRRWAEKRGIECFWYEGEVDHVTTRLRRAAEHANADLCVLVSADCPLVWPEGIDFLVGELREAAGIDVVGALPGPDGRPCVLHGTQVARRAAWQLADDLSDAVELRHQFPVMTRRREDFRVQVVALPDAAYGPPMRLSVDTWADLEFMRTLHDRLAERGEPFELHPALALIEAEPDLLEIHAHVHQRRTDEPERTALFSVDAGPGTDPRHLARSRELALQIVERKGWAVTFLVDDADAVRRVEERGMRAVWGAFGRDAVPPPHGTVAEPLREHLECCDLVVLDHADGRALPEGWCAELDVTACAVLTDQVLPWAGEADIVIDAAGIVRREVRLAARRPRKELDVLASLAREERRAALRRFGERHGMRIELVSGDSDEFPELLARARVYLNDTALGFREALAAGTHPVAWCAPEVARRAFRKAGARPAVVEREDDLLLLHGLLSAGSPPHPRASDGTGAIVQSLWERVEALAARASERPHAASRVRTRRR